MKATAAGNQPTKIQFSRKLEQQPTRQGSPPEVESSILALFDHHHHHLLLLFAACRNNLPYVTELFEAIRCQPIDYPKRMLLLFPAK